MKPIVAIVGRPNVGKSTLFNRIVGGHRAITLDEPGVTRDRHYAHASWDGRDFILVDTAGLPSETKEGSFEAKVKDQVEMAIREANVILFVMDGRQGMLPEEKKMALILKRSDKKVLLVINKIDHLTQDADMADFYALGEDLFPVSSEHGIRVNDLLDKVVSCLPPDAPKGESFKGIKVALLGKPNVGKSSLLNQLIGEERALVHNEPGTTRDAVDTPLTVHGQDYLLIDTAGIRRRGTWSNTIERYSVLSSLKAIERADVCLLLLDAKEGIHKQDAHIAGYIQEGKRSLVLIWNKWDLMEDREKTRKEHLSEVEYHLKFLPHVPVLFISAKTGKNCGDIWKIVQRLYQAAGKRIATSEVNKMFELIISAHNPPVYKGKPVKFFYATQIGIFPPSFLIFVNEPAGVHFSFKRYLVNSFRDVFGFKEVPVEIYFRKKNKGTRIKPT